MADDAIQRRMIYGVALTRLGEVSGDVEDRMLNAYGFFATRVTETGGFMVVKVRRVHGIITSRIYTARGYDSFVDVERAESGSNSSNALAPDHVQLGCFIEKIFDDDCDGYFTSQLYAYLLVWDEDSALGVENLTITSNHEEHEKFVDRRRKEKVRKPTSLAVSESPRWSDAVDSANASQLRAQMHSIDRMMMSKCGFHVKSHAPGIGAMTVIMIRERTSEGLIVRERTYHGNSYTDQVRTGFDDSNVLPPDELCLGDIIDTINLRSYREYSEEEVYVLLLQNRRKVLSPNGPTLTVRDPLPWEEGKNEKMSSEGDT